MSNLKLLNENYYRNFIAILLLILFIGTALSGLILYSNIQKPLDSHYSAILSVITDFKDSLMLAVIKVNIIFYSLIAVGVGILTLLYTHRIAGPLYRIQMSARAIGEGKLDTVTSLRRNDAVNPLAESLNNLTRNHSRRVSEITSEVQQLKTAIAEHRKLKDQNENAEVVEQEILSLDKRIKGMIETVTF